MACDINILKKYVSPEYIEKLDLDMDFSTTKVHYTGFKATVILEKNILCSISVIIHSGVKKNDSKIFDEVLEELSKRSLLKTGHIILCGLPNI